MTALSPTEARETLAGLLDEGCDAGESLARELAAEFRALEAEDLDGLATVTAAKNASLARLEGIEARRRDLFERAELPEGPAGIESLLAGADPGFAASWHHYIKVAMDCRQANLTNGAILRLRRQQVTAALQALAGDSPATYGPTGDGGRGPSRSLAEA